ncbi:MAG: hypothetical protein IK088_06525 [Lachnospiraceae bacterium]|nr:hypothetical protein [Lachnospiraceae bacterium]
MLEIIKRALRALSVDSYTIEEETKESSELFFVKKALDLRRMKDVTLWTVRVFRAFTEGGRDFLGDAEFTVSPGTNETELQEQIRKAYISAGTVKNPAYPLYRGTSEDTVTIPSGLNALSTQEIAASFADSLFKADVREDAFINSAEFFAEKVKVRFVSSENFEKSYEKCSVRGEFVTQCKVPQDVEQYFSFCYEDFTPEALTEKTEKALDTVRDRAAAYECPKSGSCDVILSGENLKGVLQYYLARANAMPVFAGYFDKKPGDSIQGEAVKGEKLKITLLPNVPFSREGIPMRERPLLKDGVLQFLQADQRFASYMNIEPTGMYRKMRVENGTVPFETLKKGCLYPVTFSDLQVDPMSGRFGGEIRLAYFFGEDGVKILTGGSVNGTITEKQDDLVFSTEKYEDSDYSGPFAVRMKGIAVAGI